MMLLMFNEFFFVEIFLVINSLLLLEGVLFLIVISRCIEFLCNEGVVFIFMKILIKYNLLVLEVNLLLLDFKFVFFDIKFCLKLLIV